MQKISLVTILPEGSTEMVSVDDELVRKPLRAITPAALKERYSVPSPKTRATKLEPGNPPPT